MASSREHFGGRFAVIMAMAGSAIGLGNIWRFPYMAGQNGGGAFLIVYIAACLLLALPIFYAETIIGRRSGANTFGAMAVLAPGSRWRWLGLLTIVTPIILLSYYSVVGGWSVEYLFKALAFDFSSRSDLPVTGFFGTFISSVWQPILVHTVFLTMVVGVVLGGVKRGIERFSKTIMPLLFLLMLVLAGYAITLPGAGKGVAYLFRPDFSKLTPAVAAAAMGQAFFSLSLGVGTILTYASYMKKDENMLASGVGTAVSDLFFALLSGLAIMPAVFAAGLEPGAGPGLVFETLPYLFQCMSGTASAWLSAVISILFFFTVLFAALTSAVSILEVGVAYLSEERNMSRTGAALAVGLFAWGTGILCSLSFGPLSHVQLLGNNVFDFLDKLCSNWLLPLGGLLFTLFVGWKMQRADVWDEFTNGGILRANRAVFPVVWFLVRYVAPAGILVVFLSNLFL